MPFLRVFSPKINIIVQLEFEHSFSKVTVQHISHSSFCLTWFSLVLWHINQCRLLMPNPFL